MNVDGLKALNDFLENFQDERYELNQKIKQLEEEKDFQVWKWQKHISIKKDDYRKDLPCPRLECNIFSDGGEQGWNIGMVFPSYGESGVDKFIPFSQTTTTSKEILSDKTPKLPYRGEYDLYAYSRVFEMKMFLTRDNDELIHELFIKEGYEECINDFLNKNCRL